MKITLDTSKIGQGLRTAVTTAATGTNSMINRSISRYTDREVLFICMSTILGASILTQYLDNRRIGRVEVALEKVQEDIRKSKGEIEVIIEKDSTTNKIESNGMLPRTEFPQLYNTNKRIKLTNKEFNCLAKNIYFEAKFEPYIGKIAVANVTYNRLMQRKWGDDVCSVVHAKNQFSWRLFKKMREEVPSGPKWVASKHAAEMFTRGVRITNLSTSDHYFASYIKKPIWVKSMTHVGDIGLHKFYASN
nr:MAG: hypothetical protein [Caudoviricetes sp.]